MRKIAVLLLLGVLGGPGLRAEEPQIVPTFKASVNLVPISAVVHDRRGRLVTTLTAADFEITDKGEQRRILDFQLDQTSPLTIALLVDVSGSMRVGPKLAFARLVLERIVADLEDGRDEVGLFTFDKTLHEPQSFTMHRIAIDTALEGAEPFGTTSLYDAIAATARRLEGRPSPRRAIVVFTDGVDTSSALTPAEVSGLASSIDVPVYVVITVPPIDHTRFLDRAAEGVAPPSADLRDLALWTGGDLVWATSPLDAGLRAHQILTELRHQYLIAIESATQPEWRPLDIRVRDRRLNVRARSGYFSHDKPLSH